MKNIIKAVLALATLAIVSFAIYDNSSTPDMKFSELRHEAHKVKWLTEYQGSMKKEVLAFDFQLQEGIKSRFKVPEEVEFVSGTPIVNQARIKDAEKGVFIQQGQCLAKNAFGVKTKHLWEVEYVLTDQVKEIKRVEVFNL